MVLTSIIPLLYTYDSVQVTCIIGVHTELAGRSAAAQHDGAATHVCVPMSYARGGVAWLLHLRNTCTTPIQSQ